MKSKSNSFLRAVALILALSCMSFVNSPNVYAGSADKIIFADTALEQKLISLGVDGGDSIITQDEMSALTGSLDLSNSDIVDLSGLEYATSISDLDLSNNNISNVTALKSLTALINLDVSNNYITQDDITNLESMLPSCTITSSTQRIMVDSITLANTTKTLCIGDSYSISAKVSPTTATDKTLSYSSSKTSVATVSSTGVVKPKALGKTTITVTAQNNKVSAKCVISVLNNKLYSRVYKINRNKNWIYGILPNTKLSSLKKKFLNYPSDNISVYKGSKKT